MERNKTFATQFYSYKMNRKESYQNLLVMATIDNNGNLTFDELALLGKYSRSLELTDEEFADLTNNIASLDFVIYQNEDIAFNELFSMLIVALCDGDLNDQEENALHQFAIKSGFPESEYLSIKEELMELYNNHITNAIEHNKKEYDAVLLKLQSLGKTDLELAQLFKKVISPPDINFTVVELENEEVIHALYCWVWIVYRRYVVLNEIGLGLFSMDLDLLLSNDISLPSHFEKLKLAENNLRDTIKYAILNSSISFFKEELSLVFPFTQN